MPSFTLACGCEAYAYVSVSYDCECCGTDYEIDEAEITQACDTHGG